MGVVSKAKSLGSERTSIRHGRASPPGGDMWYSSLSPGQPAWWGERETIPMRPPLGLRWCCRVSHSHRGKGPGDEICPTLTRRKGQPRLAQPHLQEGILELICSKGTEASEEGGTWAGPRISVTVGRETERS